MNPHISAITLGVRDLSRAKHFYSEGLGWPIQVDRRRNTRSGVGTSATSPIWTAISGKSWQAPGNSRSPSSRRRSGLREDASR